MRVLIRSMRLENFKGCKSRALEFGSKSTVSGANGVGKTTIATAFYWLFFDKDYDLHSNPAIRPMGADEVTPRVEVVLDVDGREVTVAKFQKCTVKKSKTGGADTVSLSNSYEVNAVEYGERDFRAKMAEYGFDFGLFLPLSHPEVFTGQKAIDMRKVLFSMVSEKTDYEIAQATEGASEVLELLTNYTIEEIKAMQNATLRKIKEDYGKDGEILRAKIEGLEAAKIDIDVAETELGKKAILELIKSNTKKQEDISVQYEEYQKLSDGIIELKFAESDLQRKANASIVTQKKELQDKIAGKEFLLKQTEQTISETKAHISSLEENIKRFSKEIEKYRKQYADVQNLAFDETDVICRYCGQEYPAEKKEQIKCEFEQKKKDELQAITVKGNACKKNIDDSKKDLEEKEVELKSHIESLQMLKASIDELQAELDKVPDAIDISDSEEYKALQEKIAEKEQAMKNCSSAEDIRCQLRAEENELQEQLLEFEKRIAIAGRNVEIDEQIVELRDKQRGYEQQKADCEKILYQLDLVSRKKNELLQSDVNSHFELVDFKLFDYLKNGEYKECCVPQYKGKDMSISTNTGLEIMMKCDIIKGLQKFYEQHYPVFIDGAECLSEETKKRIDMDCQVVYLAVSEDKELRIEVA